MVWDLCAFFMVLGFVHWVRVGWLGPEIFFSPGLWVVTFILLCALYVFGLYELSDEDSFWPHLLRLWIALGITVVVVIMINYFLSKDRAGIFGRGVLLGGVVLYGFFNSAYRWILWSSFRRIEENRQWLVIASDKILKALQGELNSIKVPGQLKIVALDQIENSKVLENLWSSVVLGCEASELPQKLTIELMDKRLSGQPVMDLTKFFEEYGKKIPVFHVGHEWFLTTEGFRLLHNPLGLRLKRLIDLLLSFFLIVLLWPVMLLTAIAIKLETRGPAIFRQRRTGKDGQDFVILKFRSMRVDAEKDGARWASLNDDRVTRVGRFIRKTRLDELPQLFNVFSGEMSFVGPRPERPEFNANLEKEIPFYNLRHLVRPGITGWAQILYPYGASVEDARQKLQYDLFYIKNYSLLLDINIILKTVAVVLFGRGR
ncbi:MAG: sugar transferase [Bdellovibrionaceae bacterium]|nr:sugar transferase [Pseudobdellovibrionaceae bacterium]